MLSCGRHSHYESLLLKSGANSGCGKSIVEWGAAPSLRKRFEIGLSSDKVSQRTAVKVYTFMFIFGKFTQSGFISDKQWSCGLQIARRLHGFKCGVEYEIFSKCRRVLSARDVFYLP